MATVAKFTGGGLGIGGGIYFVRWLILLFFGRIDRRQAQIDAEGGELDLKWRAYRKVLEERVDKQDEKIARQDAEIEKCHQEKYALEERLVKLEAFADARGEMRQGRQRAASADSVIGDRTGKKPD